MFFHLMTIDASIDGCRKIQPTRKECYIEYSTVASSFQLSIIASFSKVIILIKHYKHDL